ncbi:MAG TPA: type 4a pilus biogenesis protein PilO [Nevskiaceae bacterium]|nr:type 4a pilus biogenesis protein PilO [Nevskiaceae bacterium]
MKKLDFQAGWDELQGLDWKNPGGWSQWIYYFFCIIVVVVILFGANYFEWSPRRDSLHTAQRQEVQLKHEFETKAHKAAALDAYKKQLVEMKHDFGSMLQQLPSKSEIANLLTDISNARVAAGLNEELFQPQAEVKKDFYAIVPNHIVVTGTYAQLANFVSAVAALSRIVTIDSVDIKPVAGKAAPDLLRMSALAKTYRYLSEEENRARHKPRRRR